jgi:tRNA dimethylallyltransferase
MTMPTGVTPLVAIVGPTAAGKSALAVFLAERLAGEVLACDSTQLYRHFDIGTGKVTPGERRGIPHHLLDLLEPHEVFTAGQYRQHAVAALHDLQQRKKLPVLTVGTGLYLRALLDGLADAPGRSEELRKRLRQRAVRRGAAHLHRVLHKFDPDSAARIAPADEPKVIRAIEVRLLSGRPLSEVHRAARPGLPGFAAIKIGLAPRRAELYGRIDRRVEGMLAQGWEDEVRALLRLGIPATAKPFQFIGYAQIRAGVEASNVSTEARQAMTAAIQQATRQYAKRQMTWFRKEPAVRWFEGFGDDEVITRAALAHVRRQLAASARNG